MRTGIPRRDLPPYFGEWSAIYRRFNLWSKKGVLTELFHSLSRLADTEWLFIDGSIIRAHQHSTGAVTDHDESISKSSGGNKHDVVHGKSLIVNSIVAKIVVAAKGYDSETLRNYVREGGAAPIIPPKGNSLVGNDDKD
jgi:hypothetical protein